MHRDACDCEAIREELAECAGGSRGFGDPHVWPPGQGDGHDDGSKTRCVGSRLAFLSWPVAPPVRAVQWEERGLRGFGWVWSRSNVTMATVHWNRDCHDGFDEDPSQPFEDPMAVADSGHSDVCRAAEDCRPVSPRKASTPLHRVADVRRRQGVTLRNVARRLGLSLAVVRRQEQADCDLRLSDLHRWQEVLEVPIAELLVESEGQLSGPVLERSRMVKLMKTAAALRERTGGTPIGRMVEMLVEQILEIMPELADVTPWHTVGQRRTLDDVGRTAQTLVSEDVFRRPIR